MTFHWRTSCVRIVAVCAVVCVFALDLPAASRWQARSWTTDDALPQGTVHAIRQTRDGHLWFTTFGGLVRYDGTSFKVFQRATSPGIAGTRFTTLHEDRAGTLWAGTEDGWVVSARDENFRSHQVGLRGNGICWIGETAGELWVISNQGFFVFERDRFVRRAPPSFGSSTFTTPHAFGYNQGFAYATPSAIEIIRPDLRRSLPAAANRVYTGGDGVLWATDRTRLLRIRDGVAEPVAVSPLTAADIQAITAVLSSEDGALWVAVNGKGVARIHERSAVWIGSAEGLAALHVMTLFEDREGTIWAGTFDNGISRIRPGLTTVWSRANGLADPNVYPVIAGNSGMLVGTWGGGVFRLAGDRFERIGPPKGTIMSLLEDADGTIWASDFEAGVVRLRTGERRVFTHLDGLPHSIVPVLYRDRAGRMWAGTYDGLAAFDRQRERFDRVSLPEGWRRIHVIAEDREGTLVLGTTAGVARIGNAGFEVITAQRGMVRALHVDDDGTIWAGTYDSGLFRIRRGRVSTITTRQGLFDNGVFAILEDGPFFWMSCNRGIYRVARAELNAVADGLLQALSVMPVTRRDGLESAECNGGVQSAGCKTADGRLWFPTQRGIVTIDPRVLRSSGTPAQARLTRAAVDGREVSPTSPLRLRGGPRLLEFEFSSITLVDAERVRYRYRLEGLDMRWTQSVGPQRVTYGRLPGGRYRFVVGAANAAGDWSVTPASVEISVLPPFWRTWWFAAIAAAAVMAAVVLLFRDRVKRIEQRRIAQAEFSRRLLVQQEEERKRIAIDLHDGLGQSLLVIKNRALLAAEDGQAGAPAARQLSEISATASTALEEVRRIAYNLHPAELDHLGVTRAIEAMLRRIGDASPILVSAQLDPIDGRLSKEGEVNVFRIVQEAMANVVRHSGATAAVVNISADGPRLSIRIQDNGVGLPVHTAAEARSGLGLGSIAARARMLGGTCHITSAVGEGTSVTIEVQSGRE